jgi:hypothetical protein
MDTIKLIIRRNNWKNSLLTLFSFSSSFLCSFQFCLFSCSFSFFSFSFSFLFSFFSLLTNMEFKHSAEFKFHMRGIFFYVPFLKIFLIFTQFKKYDHNFKFWHLYQFFKLNILKKKYFYNFEVFNLQNPFHDILTYSSKSINKITRKKLKTQFYVVYAILKKSFIIFDRLIENILL